MRHAIPGISARRLLAGIIGAICLTTQQLPSSSAGAECRGDDGGWYSYGAAECTPGHFARKLAHEKELKKLVAKEESRMQQLAQPEPAPHSRQAAGTARPPIHPTATRQTPAKLPFLDLIIALIIIPAYFAPSLVAFARIHSKRQAILALNILLGWTAIFWVAALVWALTENNATPDRHRSA